MRFLASQTAVMAALATLTTALPAQQGGSAATEPPAAETTASSASETDQGIPFHLPPLTADLEPGIYRLNHDAFGRPNRTRLGDIDITDHGNHPRPEPDNSLTKRVNNWYGCEGYSMTPAQQATLSDAWNSLWNWAAAEPGSVSPWIEGDYFAMSDSGAFAYFCQWGDGNTASTKEIDMAKGMVNAACPGKAGIYQWNEWKKGIGAATVGNTWCNGVGYPDRR